ncbi:hypothetical protein [Weissella minor]|uniref:hypothetical protein n=1 Tax=Weissella minor TaxID=1620 RepID=UPI003AF27C42
MGFKYVQSDSQGMKQNLKTNLNQGKDILNNLTAGGKQIVNAVTDNKYLHKDTKDYLNKNAGDPMTISNNFNSHVNNNFGVAYGRY